jgi:hypothetical protein
MWCLLPSAVACSQAFSVLLYLGHCLADPVTLVLHSKHNESMVGCSVACACCTAVLLMFT